MARARLLTAVAGVAVSLAVSIAAYVLFDTLLVFLFVPFVPFLFRDRRTPRAERRCPQCGWRTRSAEFEYCPRDGTRLRRR